MNLLLLKNIDIVFEKDKFILGLYNITNAVVVQNYL